MIHLLRLILSLQRMSKLPPHLRVLCVQILPEIIAGPSRYFFLPQFVNLTPDGTKLGFMNFQNIESS